MNLNSCSKIPHNKDPECTNRLCNIFPQTMLLGVWLHMLKINSRCSRVTFDKTAGKRAVWEEAVRTLIWGLCPLAQELLLLPELLVLVWAILQACLCHIPLWCWSWPADWASWLGLRPVSSLHTCLGITACGWPWVPSLDLLFLLSPSAVGSPSPAQQPALAAP